MISSRTQRNVPYSSHGEPHTFSQRQRKHRTQRVTDPWPAYQQCTRSSPPSLQRGPDFFAKNILLPAEQKGCGKGSYGCKDQLLINKAILQDVKSRKKNLSAAWIDYKKASDSMPHSWIEKTLKIYRVCPTTIKFITESTKTWKTTLNIHHADGSLTSRLINKKWNLPRGLTITSTILPCTSPTQQSTKQQQLWVHITTWQTGSPVPCR